MKKQGTRGSIRTVLLAALLLAKVGAFAQFEGWHRDLGSARAEAKQRQVPLLIVFVHEGCPVCTELESHLAKSRARQALAPLAKVVLEFMENRGLAARYGVDATPTILVYCPSGECIYRYEGSLSSAGLASLARRALASCSRTEVAETDRTKSNPASPTQALGAAKSGTKSTVSETLRELRARLSRAPRHQIEQKDPSSATLQYVHYKTHATRLALKRTR